jgi:hypothetical protein
MRVHGYYKDLDFLDLSFRNFPDLDIFVIVSKRGYPKIT